ncbi:MAG: ATP-binding cassette domain-containing protein [Ignavibacteriales bacterium]|nr:ATP-binding cassette domain-containing protein [Ignavibacteriales bacterium]
MSMPPFNITIAKHGRNLVNVKDFRMEENHIMFLFGESGIGKSLIAKAIYGLLSPEEFDITINGESYDQYCKKSSTKEIQQSSFFVFQEPSSHLNPLSTIGSQLNEGSLRNRLQQSNILQRLWETTDRNIMTKMLGIYPKPYRPSGGEKQRFLLAMAFLKIEMLLETMPEHIKTLFVFDEPSGSLDNHFRDVFLSLLFEKYQKRKFTVLLITHDYSVISVVRNAGLKILNDISYKELMLKHKELTLNDFKPEYYTNWLKRQEESKLSSVPIRVTQPLLRVESGIEVFGRRLVVMRDRTGGSSCPLEINPFTMVYLKAPSGVGKTSFAKSIMGLIRAQHLNIALNGVSFTEETPKRFWQTRVWGKQMAITFQHADEALNQQSTVRGTLSGLPANKSTAEDVDHMMRELFEGDINDRFLNTKVQYLSGGQKQKLNLLRSLVLDTDILILDEPLNGVDFENIMRVLSMLKQKQKSGKGILLISHNEEIFDAIVPEEYVYYLQAFQLASQQ